MPTHEANGSRTYAEADCTDFAHTGAGTLAGRWMRMFWQPVYCSEDLPPGHARPARTSASNVGPAAGSSVPSRRPAWASAPQRGPAVAADTSA